MCSDRRKLMRKAGLAGLLMGALLGGCSSDPYQVGAPQAVKDYIDANLFDKTEKPRAHPWDPIGITQPVSLCYSRQLNTPNQVEGVAKEFCKGGEVSFYGQDFFWNGCGLLQPHRATFVCRPGSSQGAAN